MRDLVLDPSDEQRDEDIDLNATTTYSKAFDEREDSPASVSTPRVSVNGYRSVRMTNGL